MDDSFAAETGLVNQLFDELLDLSPFSISLTLLKDGRYLLANKAFCKNTGYAIEEILGRTPEQLNLYENPEDRERIRVELRQKGQLIKYDIKFRGKDGSIYYNQISAKIVLYGGEECLLAVTSFVTALKKVQQALIKSEEKYCTILNTMEEGYFEVDLTGRLTFFNNAVTRMHGYGPEELAGLHNIEYMTKETAKKVYAVYNQVYKTGIPAKMLDFEVLRKDGSAVILESSVVLRRDDDGNPIGFSGVIRDRTQQKKAEWSLQESERNLRITLDSIGDAVIATDMDGIVVRMNPVAEKLTGWCLSQGFGRDLNQIFSIVDEKSGKPLENPVDKVLREHQTVVMADDVQMIAKDGTTFTISVNAAPMMKSAGQIAGVVLVFRDISEKKRAEKALVQNEEKYRTILMEMEEGYYEIDVLGNLTYFNESARSHFGYSAEELKGLNYRRYVPSYQIKSVKDLFKGIYQTGVPVKSWDHQIQRKDGSVLTLEMSAYPLKQAHGQIVGFWGITRDQTERRKAEAALHESEAKLHSIFENANEGIYILQNGRIQFVNPKFTQALGFSVNEVMDSRFIDFVHPDDQQSEYVQDQERSLNQLSGIYAFRMVNKKNETQSVEISTVGIAWNGKPGSLNFLRDITLQKKMEDQLLQAQKMEAIGTLAGGIAHDFNNILSGVIGYSELSLKEVQNQPRLAHKLEQILAAGLRARDLVQQILIFSRQKEHELTPLQIEPLIKEALKLLRCSIPKTIEIRQQINSNLDFVMADSTQIHRIIMNLCTNAAHAMEENGGQLTVSLSQVVLIEQDNRLHPGLKPGRYLKLSIQDAGHGISAENIPKIFDPYFTTKSKEKGTGLGLSVVHGIINNYGGAIFVYSEPGRGTLFNVYLPSLKRELVKPQSQEETILTGCEHILLVDDEPVLIEVGQMMLETLGYTVTACDSSLSAWSIFSNAPEDIDLVISDVTMPKMTGDRLAREMLRVRPDLPILLCTGFSDKVNNRIVAEIGIKAVIMKPFIQKDLALVVRRVLDEVRKER